jgi:hypothetical protein
MLTLGFREQSLIIVFIGTEESAWRSGYQQSGIVVRIDGDIKKDAELSIKYTINRR